MVFVILGGLFIFPLGQIVLYTVFLVLSLPNTLVKTLAKNLVYSEAFNTWDVQYAGCIMHDFSPLSSIPVEL